MTYCSLINKEVALTRRALLRIHSNIGMCKCLTHVIRRTLKQSVEALANNYLYIENDTVYCHEVRFEAWQDLISKISPIPLLAALFLHNFANSGHLPESALCDPALELALKKALQWSPLPSCDIQKSNSPRPAPPLQNYFDLHDAHVHFSGIMQADMAWQRCLADIHGVCEKLACRRGGSLADVFLREGIKDVESLRRRLYFARWLQETLSLLAADECRLPEAMRREREDRQRLKWDTWSILCRQSSDCDCWFEAYFPRRKSASGIGCRYFMDGEGTAHPLAQCEHYSPFWPGASGMLGNNLAYEGILWIRNLKNPSPLIACMLHAYILLSSQFRRIALHQPNTEGFDSFNAASHCGLTRAHHIYQNQFMQLHTMDGRQFNMLDCRFTPMDKKASNFATYNKYVRAVYGEEPVMLGFSRLQPAAMSPFRQLRLRPHFIKNKDAHPFPLASHPGTTRVPCRHAKMRNVLERQAKALCFQEKSNPCGLLYGKDAAGNEELCPPEVFAPSFRLLSNHTDHWATLAHTTYHVGEIFSDVTSGLRAIDETLRFLELRPGDRIGHGTVLGIDPAWWRQRKPRAKIRQGALLDNYVWLWRIWEKVNSRDSTRTQRELMESLCGASQAESVYHPLGEIERLCNEISRLYREIYVNVHDLYVLNEQDIPNVLYRAWKMRTADALRLEEKSRADMSPWERKEIDIIDKFREDINAFKIFTNYHTDAYTRRKYEIPVEVNMGYIDDETIRVIQDYMILVLNEKKISVEVMPTSNKLIMGYKTYDDHHALRWLKSNPDDSRPAPSVLLASDNPGVFSTNIFNEYAHLLIALKNSSHGNISDVNSFNMILPIQN